MEPEHLQPDPYRLDPPRERPKCPLDGRPLARISCALEQPTVYEHEDGTRHTDYTPALREGSG